MIRINLLAEGRRPVVARRSRPKIAFGDQDPSVYFLAGGLILGLLVVGIWWFLLSSKIEAKLAEIRVARREVQELRPILKEVKSFKKKKRELERKIRVIQDLTEKQKGPVQVMDRVSRALPDLVWINTMNFRGRTVDLNGTAFNTNAVASFIENLDDVPEFREPDTKNIVRSRGGNYDFRISFRFRRQRKAEPKPEEGAAEAVPADAAEGGSFAAGAAVVNAAVDNASEGAPQP